MTLPLARILPPCLAVLALLLGGCATYDTDVARGRSLAGIKKYFVVSNLNDNHALDHHLAASLRARGFEAEVGPLTMMPDDTQAVVTYQDYWAWDFGDRLTFFRLHVRSPTSASRSPRSPSPLACRCARSPPSPRPIDRPSVEQ